MDIESEPVSNSLNVPIDKTEEKNETSIGTGNGGGASIYAGQSNPGKLLGNIAHGYTPGGFSLAVGGGGGWSSSTHINIANKLAPLEEKIKILEKKCEQLLEIANKQEDKIFELENQISSLQSDKDDVKDLYLDTFSGKVSLPSNPKATYYPQSKQNITAKDIKDMLDQNYGKPYEPWLKFDK